MTEESSLLPATAKPLSPEEEKVALSARQSANAKAPRSNATAVGRGRLIRLLTRQVERVNKMMDLEDVSHRVIGQPSAPNTPVVRDDSLIGTNPSIRQELQVATAMFKAINDVDLGDRGQVLRERMADGGPLNPNLIGSELDPSSDDTPPGGSIMTTSSIRLRAVLAQIEQTVQRTSTSKVPSIDVRTGAARVPRKVEEPPK